MAVFRRIGEGTAFKVRVRFYDEDDLPMQPQTVKYRIDCETTGETIREWTTVSPGSDFQIAVTTADTRIVDDGNAEELRSLTLVADDDLETQFVMPTPYQYVVTNVGRGKKVLP